MQTLDRFRGPAEYAPVHRPAPGQAYWDVRESSLGVTAHVPASRCAGKASKSSAVGPDKLGAYLRDCAS